nr:hypothetical protein [Planotetraspora thailandica]
MGNPATRSRQPHHNPVSSPAARLTRASRSPARAEPQASDTRETGSSQPYGA